MVNFIYIRSLVEPHFSCQSEWRQHPFVGAYKSVLPGDKSAYVGGQFSKVLSSRGIPALQFKTLGPTLATNRYHSRPWLATRENGLPAL